MPATKTEWKICAERFEAFRREADVLQETMHHASAGETTELTTLIAAVQALHARHEAWLNSMTPIFTKARTQSRKA